ncbi:doubled CXXCH motif protein [Geothermobacter ehrlichii]|uniref:nitrite reductase (cytochrome; ammonia-forming) n=1 Tax=Geothermobacter ehrlichii TaxID=213224 RepID=A0A5D3WL91_9BACT|nr:cytochrome c3 family protein [Geothermobacter ehrlichii]TYO98733.1 doubled CXXCH motif protein [Geothermobacter ehrlichii]
MKKLVLILLAGFVGGGLLLLSPADAMRNVGRTVLDGAHGDRQLLPRTCRACHRGMAMAIRGEEEVCYACHGSQDERDKMRRAGLLGDGARLDNIAREFRKPYRHPVEKSRGVHHPQERLPEEQVNAARHVECVDCHHPHQVDRDQPFRGMVGKRVGNFQGAIENEYELCYRCHAESANLPIGSTNKHAEFKQTNRSYHPVEAEGRNLYVISLLPPYNERKENPGDVTRMTCSDCHGSDDASGPQGPHGSNYAGLLRLNYDTSDERPESRYAYELCYRCHDRTSILSNESFPYHALHIRGNPAGTSCHTCHDAHGSSKYQYLIRFNEEVVSPTADGKLEFKATGIGTRHGSCLLNCHGVEHNPMSY